MIEGKIMKAGKVMMVLFDDDLFYGILLLLESDSTCCSVHSVLFWWLLTVYWWWWYSRRVLTSCWKVKTLKRRMLKTGAVAEKKTDWNDIQWRTKKNMMRRSINDTVAIVVIRRKYIVMMMMMTIIVIQAWWKFYSEQLKWCSEDSDKLCLMNSMWKWTIEMTNGKMTWLIWRETWHGNLRYC